jgi:phosphoribosylaminoimidazole-succinocarboxamide synthase
MRFGIVDDFAVITATPTIDNSLLWAVDTAEVGVENEQFVFGKLDAWLEHNWQEGSEPPTLPTELKAQLSERYIAVAESISDEELAHRKK